ncbi:MAG: heavy metal translocating P-type ATPase [Butyrivibrio sp.]|uniref:heavy metal translocating P-type ATPase n=1 Tax=Butyrivibrio sp. TaxID=28121 RepID=UPI001B499C2D|nr:heavy metal translocating P-type ATPase [Butyrivibrio sp.]MBP3783664.1 heavy metal translocating P-type ATPase [Butyrivibrio sp.]
MDKYIVTGMSCAACQARVEKAVSSLDGVDSCSVNLLTNSMSVEGSANNADIIKAVENAGYGARLMGDNNKESSSSYDFSEEEEALKDKETPILKKRLIYSIGFLLVLMYFSMGHMMFGFPLPPFLEGNHVAHGIIQMVLAIIIMFINRKFFISGFKGLVHGAPNMDTLVALGSGASFVYSMAALFLMTDALSKGDSSLAMSYMDHFYFESAAMILTLITVGKMLEAMSKGRTTDAIKSLMKLAPKTAVIIDEYGKEKEIPIENIKVGDIFVVRPGENVPVDGIVIEGNSAINESALTGESIPVDKTIGSTVSGATINTSGFIKCRATRVGKDTTLSQIIQMVSDASATKAPIAKIADKVSGVFVPAVIGIAAITFIIWFLITKEFGYSLSRAIAVLVISCPCALGLATPVAIMVGNGVGAKNGIMFKTAASLENAGRTQIVALDKTGTITKGEPVVTDVFTTDSVTRSGYSLINSSENELLKIAGLLEKKSEHPLAKAVVDYVGDLRVYSEDPYDEDDEDITDFEVLPGHGLRGKYLGQEVVGASLKYISSICSVQPEVREKAVALASQGKTPLCFARNNKLIGIIAVADTIKEDSAKAIKELKNMGIHVVMITGDNARTAIAIGDQAGVDEIAAEVLPDGKEEIVKKLSSYGKVAMVGDGINDAPALTRADTGIAIGAGTDVAIDAADVVLLKNSLLDVAAAIRLSRATLRNIHQNLFWAFIYNIIGIPLAAGAYIKLFGWELSPMFGAAAMSLSSFFVVTNALRLNLLKIHDSSKDKVIKKPVTGEIINNNINTDERMEKEIMTKTMMIEGMMCGHCEMTVKKALEAIEGVENADVSHEKGSAVVTLSGDVSEDALKKAVEDKDYKVTSIN